MDKRIITIVIFLGLCTGVYFTQTRMDAYAKKMSKYYVEKNLLITLPTPIIKNLTLGFDNMLADIVWVQFIQYFGENVIIQLSGSKDYDFSFTYKYIDVITTLDPDFAYAYWFGAFAIADEMGEPDMAIQLINRGIKNNPDNWWLPYTGCIMELMYHNNFVDARKYIDMAAKIEPDMPRISRLKKVLHSKAEKQEKARLVWMDIYKEAVKQGDTVSMNRAKRNLKKLGYAISE